MSKKKFSFYVVYYVNERKALRFYNWDDADKARRRGHPCLVKGFYSDDEFEVWRDSLTMHDIIRALQY